jgi:hypothetical protein
MMDAKTNTFKEVTFYRTFLLKPHIWQNKFMATLLLFGVLIIGACHKAGPEDTTSDINVELSTEVVGRHQVKIEDTTQTPAEISLFDGKTLGHWKKTDFGGQGKVYVKDNCIYLEQGNDMTGVTWSGPLVRTNYEITLEAMRVSGSDFFCGLTFPVNENYCSLILGGWGGSLCGLSNIDYYDAANNETTRFVSFENGKWYHVRLRVEPNRIQAWLQEEGEEPLVDMDITGRKIDTRFEMDLCQPMGIATWQTAGAVRNIRLRKLKE